MFLSSVENFEVPDERISNLCKLVGQFAFGGMFHINAAILEDIGCVMPAHL